MKPISISAAKHIAQEYDYHQVIVIARHVGEGGGEHVTTYGKDKEHCRAAAKIGDFLKFKVMGWPEYDEVDRLRRELEEAREQLEIETQAASGMSDDLSALGRKFDDFVESVREWRDEQEERYAELGHDPDLRWTPCPEGADELDQLLEVETFLRPSESDLLCEDEREYVEQTREGWPSTTKHLLDIIDRLAPRSGVERG